MAYCRFGDGDLYVYLHVDGALTCCGCLLGRIDESGYGRSFYAKSTDEMIRHVGEHVTAGHDVPVSLIAELEADRESIEEFIGRQQNV